MVLSPIYKGTLTQSFNLQENELSETYGNYSLHFKKKKFMRNVGWDLRTAIY